MEILRNFIASSREAGERKTKDFNDRIRMEIYGTKTDKNVKIKDSNWISEPVQNLSFNLVIDTWRSIKRPDRIQMTVNDVQLTAAHAITSSSLYGVDECRRAECNKTEMCWESLMEFNCCCSNARKKHITWIKFASVGGPSSCFMFLSLIIFQCWTEAANFD